MLLNSAQRVAGQSDCVREISLGDLLFETDVFDSDRHLKFPNGKFLDICDRLRCEIYRAGIFSVQPGEQARLIGWNLNEIPTQLPGTSLGVGLRAVPFAFVVSIEVH